MPHALVKSNRVARGFNPRVYRMKVTFGSQVIAAGICGILSFTFLATALGTEYWYIIDMNPTNMSDSEDLSSHSGLWSINEGALLPPKFCPLFPYLFRFQHSAKLFPLMYILYFSPVSGGIMHADFIDSFAADYSKYSETELHMLSESLPPPLLVIIHSLLMEVSWSMLPCPHRCSIICLFVFRNARCNSGGAFFEPGPVVVWWYLWTGQLPGPQPCPPHQHSFLLLHLQ